MLKVLIGIFNYIRAKKGLKWAIISLFILLIVLTVFYSGYFYSGFRNNKASVSSSIETNINLKKNEDLKENCDGGIFEDNLEKWIIKYYDKADEDGFYCPRSNKFSSPDIWYKYLVPTDFNSFTIRFRMKNKKDSTEDPPVFIFSVGENPRILRFYVAERNPEIIGFQKITMGDSELGLKRESVRYLDYPIEYNGDIELNVRMIVSRANKVTFYFNLSYISEFYNEPTEAVFSYDIDLLDPNLDSELSNLNFGFGTIKGSCVKPISYKICY